MKKLWMFLVMKKPASKCFNISDEKYVTFNGLARACTLAAEFSKPEIFHYNPKEFAFRSRLHFPLTKQSTSARMETRIRPGGRIFSPPSDQILTAGNDQDVLVILFSSNVCKSNRKQTDVVSRK
ncbi:chloroplast stem-loop binding protein of 41 kDa b chloroplastic [Tripterygium wilfordii]|uniref:Chloroplast stem-loop binding protein of 41 kDa b chloroplastic n=1 Tax=Tripterygium wilfordii TaxID=458696 RepID=A0A7J7DK03_TRIWF|nr:chloroplast stem-loop binding protein of 41 kDa b chloroplastic [Tripterygium wilfordii]